MHDVAALREEFVRLLDGIPPERSGPGFVQMGSAISPASALAAFDQAVRTISG